MKYLLVGSKSTSRLFSITDWFRTTWPTGNLNSSALGFRFISSICFMYCSSTLYTLLRYSVIVLPPTGTSYVPFFMTADSDIGQTVVLVCPKSITTPVVLPLAYSPRSCCAENATDDEPSSSKQNSPILT